jgi:hypothetical protein
VARGLLATWSLAAQRSELNHRPSKGGVRASYNKSNRRGGQIHPGDPYASLDLSL